MRTPSGRHHRRAREGGAARHLEGSVAADEHEEKPRARRGDGSARPPSTGVSQATTDEPGEEMDEAGGEAAAERASSEVAARSRVCSR